MNYGWLTIKRKPTVRSQSSQTVRKLKDDSSAIDTVLTHKIQPFSYWLDWQKKTGIHDPWQHGGKIKSSLKPLEPSQHYTVWWGLRMAHSWGSIMPRDRCYFLGQRLSFFAVLDFQYKHIKLSCFLTTGKMRIRWRVSRHNGGPIEGPLKPNITKVLWFTGDFGGALKGSPYALVSIVVLSSLESL